jgi:hypothetical protein
MGEVTESIRVLVSHRNATKPSIDASGVLINAEGVSLLMVSELRSRVEAILYERLGR